MPASDRLGDDEILRRMECAWSEQCGSCLNFINAEMPLILGEREALKRELLQREDSERLRMLRLIARFKRLVHEKQEAFAERDECQRMLEDLTPGGSEFYRNPIRCRNWVQDRLSSAHASTVKAVQERDALEAKVNALTAAMECRNELTSRIRALEGERDALAARATAAEAALRDVDEALFSISIDLVNRKLHYVDREMGRLRERVKAALAGSREQAAGDEA